MTDMISVSGVLDVSVDDARLSQVRTCIDHLRHCYIIVIIIIIIIIISSSSSNTSNSISSIIIIITNNINMLIVVLSFVVLVYCLYVCIWLSTWGTGAVHYE